MRSTARVIRPVLAVPLFGMCMMLAPPAQAQSDLDALRQTCFGSGDPDARVQACNDLSNAIRNDLIAGTYTGNAIAETERAQQAALRATSEKLMRQQRASNMGVQRGSTNNCPPQPRSGAGIAC